MPRFFGQYLLEKGVLSREQLLEALARQRNKVEKIGELAVKRGYLKQEDVEKIHKEQQHTDLFFGQLAVKMGLLTEAQVYELLNIQRSNHVFLGEVIAELGYLSKSAVEEELKKFKEEEGEEGVGEALVIPSHVPYPKILSLLADLTRKHFLRVADMLVKIAGVVEEKGSTDNPYVSVFIDLKGDFQGSLLLKLSRDAAQQVVKNFGGNHRVALEKVLASETLIKDAVAEFFNILCGNFLTKLMEEGKSCDISVPRSFLDKEQKTLSIAQNTRAFTLPLNTTEGYASVTLIASEKGGR